jgi:hypothetical protein
VSSKTSEGKSHSSHTSIIHRREQEVVNIYYINESNLYGCSHVQLDIGEEKLIAVLDTGAEISLMPERIFEDVSEGLKSNATTSSKRSFDNCFWK